MSESFENEEKQDSYSGYVVTLTALNENMIREFDSLRTEINKPRKKLWFWVSVILFAYAIMVFVAITAISLSGVGSRGVDESNTVEITATIDKIQPIPYQIKFKEYNAVFSVQNEYIVVDMDELGNLTAGQTVVFRIMAKDVARTTGLSNTIFFVELKGSSDIITLQSYNDNSYGNGGFEVVSIIILSIFGALFLVFAVLCLRRSKRIGNRKNAR